MDHPADISQQQINCQLPNWKGLNCQGRGGRIWRRMHSDGMKLSSLRQSYKYAPWRQLGEGWLSRDVSGHGKGLQWPNKTPCNNCLIWSQYCFIIKMANRLASLSGSQLDVKCTWLIKQNQCQLSACSEKQFDTNQVDMNLLMQFY